MRMLICDDHRLVAESLAMVLRAAGHEVVAVLEDPGDVPDALDRVEVDVCVMDLHFGGADALAAIEDLARSRPGVRIVVLSGHLDAEHVDAVRAAGATAWAVKRGRLEDVVDLVVGQQEGALAVDKVDRWAADPLARFLTARERQVLEALARGETTAMLARRFEVSNTTVRTHVQSVLSKLGVHSRLEAVAYAVRNLLVVPDRVHRPPADHTDPALERTA